VINETILTQRFPHNKSHEIISSQYCLATELKLSPRSRISLGKPTVAHLVAKSSAFYGSRNFKAVLTRQYPQSTESSAHLFLMIHVNTISTYAWFSPYGLSPTFFRSNLCSLCIYRLPMRSTYTACLPWFETPSGIAYRLLLQHPV
jgi:hypothetical protein